eukprot:763535-Hanusia_phi.AAC.1
MDELSAMGGGDFVPRFDGLLSRQVLSLLVQLLTFYPDVLLVSYMPGRLDVDTSAGQVRISMREASWWSGEVKVNESKRIVAEGGGGEKGWM